MSGRVLKALIFFGVVALALLIIILAIIYQPKGPEVVATSTTLQHVDIKLSMLKLDITMCVNVYIKNRSNSGFEFKNSVTEVYYHGVLVGQAPVEAGKIPGGGTKHISTPVVVVGNEVISNPHFLDEVGSGSLYFTSKSSVDGKGVFLGSVRLHAQIFVTCNVIVFVLTNTLTSDCNSIVKI